MDTHQPSSSRNGAEIATLQRNESRIEISEPQGSTRRFVELANLLLTSKVSNDNNYWKGVEDYITRNFSDALTANVTKTSKVIFQTIARSAAPPWLLEKLLSRVPPESLKQMTNRNGCSPIFHAAGHGNTKFVEIFVRRNADLANTRDKFLSLPIHEAAKLGHGETVEYLLSVTTLPLDGADRVTLIKALISSNLFDIALRLLKKYPMISQGSPEDTESILELMAKRPKAFASGSRLGFWKLILYQLIPLQEEHNPYPEKLNIDLENQLIATSKIPLSLKRIANAIGVLCEKLKNMICNTLMQLGCPSIKGIRDTKLIHKQTVEIVRMMCSGARDSWRTSAEAEKSFKKPLFTAARWGVCEIVNEIINTSFLSLRYENEYGNDILDIAVLYRQENVFILLFNQLKGWKINVANFEVRWNNTLHLAGMLIPSSEVPGAALQMQRELQWFKAVENYCHSSFQDQLNFENKTPRELFTDRHKGLVEKGEKWMKETAQSCSVVAALVITVAFAAAFTVPGGSNDRGTPIHLHELSFIIFGISDSLALFSSTASVLMFLGILTSRYSEDDFLESLPKKLIIGLITLFFSIASLMVAFAATAYIVIFHPWKWVIIPMGLLGLVPVTLFISLQFPLLLEMYSSTYRPGLFQPNKQECNKKFK